MLRSETSRLQGPSGVARCVAWHEGIQEKMYVGIQPRSNQGSVVGVSHGGHGGFAARSGGCRSGDRMSKGLSQRFDLSARIRSESTVL
jgi:hypothetical protein